MPIYFPEKPADQQQYPQKGDTAGLEETGGIIYVYNLSSNSWNIVGPDNVATTDWVLNQKKDDTTLLEKGYDLVAATNDITIECLLSCNTNTDNTANELFDQSMRAHVVDDSKDYDEGLDLYLPEWEDNQIAAGNPGGASVSIAGIDKNQLVVDKDNTTNCFRTSYGETVDLILSEIDAEGNTINWMANSGVGDTIEVNFVGSVGNADYAIYRVLSQRQIDVNNVAFRVEFCGSSDPDQSWRNNSYPTTYYEFKIFKKAFSADGGDIEGKLAIYYTDIDSLLVSKADKTEDPTLVVNTADNEILANNEYTDNMNRYINVLDDNCLTTLGHLNHRLGDPDPTKVGPFMPIAGGTFLGNNEVVFKRYVKAVDGGEGGIRIKGEVGGGSTSDILRIKFDNSDGDSIFYMGNESGDDKEIMNRGMIQDALDLNLDSYLPLDGSKQMTGLLSLHPVDPTEQNHATTKAYVDSRPLIVPDVESPPDTPGSLYSKNGYLYWVKP